MRYELKPVFELVKEKHPDFADMSEYDSNYYCSALMDNSTNPPTIVATDMGEPEDRYFHRDWAWVVPLLNKLAGGK